MKRLILPVLSAALMLAASLLISASRGWSLLTSQFYVGAWVVMWLVALAWSRRQFWRAVARYVTTPLVMAQMWARASKTPYVHLLGYMSRYWLFNPYHGEDDVRRWWFLPFSVRLHHIHRADNDRHDHDHPWNARTIILRGWYREEREGLVYRRTMGCTSTLNFGEYHRIVEVSPGGVWTLFITYRKCGDWGFWVNGRKIPAREYFELQKRGEV